MTAGMAMTSGGITISAPAPAVMSVIADFAEYPDWAAGVRSTEVLDRGPDGRARRVCFVFDAAAVRDEYVLEYAWDDDRAVTWELVTARMLRRLDGGYLLQPHDGGTRVTYRLSVDLPVPLLAMLKRKAEQGIVDTALNGLKRRVESVTP